MHRVRYILRRELSGVVAVRREDGSMASGRYLVRRRGKRHYAYIQYRDGERVREKYWGIVAKAESGDSIYLGTNKRGAR